MANTRDLKGKEPTPKILIIGDSGTHKTYFAAKIPGAFVFDFDGGMAIAATAGLEVEYETFNDAPRGGRTDPAQGIYKYGQAWPKFIAKLNWIGIQIDKDAWRNPDGTMRLIALDSLTTMANAAMAYVLDEAGYIGNPQIQHWGAQMNLLETTMDQLKSWPMPLIVTAHIQRDTNDLTKSVEYLPLVTGKLAGKISLYFDEVYYAKVSGSGDAKAFVLQTESDALHLQAKTRHGVPDKTPTEWDAVRDAIMKPKGWGKEGKKTVAKAGA